jgi:hypothetical protein
MSTQLDHYRAQVKQEIITAEGKLKDVSRHIQTATDDERTALELKFKEAETQCAVSRQDATDAGLRVTQYIEDKIGSAVSKFEDWKTDRDIEKIEASAERKEQHALDSIVLAALALQEAEVALVDALAARKFAIEVAG